MRARRARSVLATLTALGLSTVVWSCSSGGGATASNVAPASTAVLSSTVALGSSSRGASSRRGTTAPGSSTPGSSTPARAPAGTSVPGLRQQTPPPAATPALSGAIPLHYTLADPNSRPTDIAAEYTIDGTSWFYCTQGAGGDGTTQLSTSPAGDAHVFVWDSAKDLGATAATVVFAICPTGQPASVSQPFAVDDTGSAPAGPTAPPPPSNVTIDRGPYLQATSMTSTRIVWRTTTATDSLVEFGPGQSLGTVAGDAQASETQHVVTLTGLTAASQYSYRITSAGSPVTTAVGFSTAPDANATSFSTVVFGDSGDPTSSGQFPLAQLMTQESCDFYLHLGDVIYPAGEDSNYIPYFFQPYGQMIAGRCLFPAVGNHEYMQANAQPYQDVFYPPTNNPANSKFYYSFDWGNAHFVSIDTNVECVSPGPGLTWLQSDLAASTKRWLVVFMHQPPYSVGHHGDNPTLIQNVASILEQYQVDLMICGHDHDYERSAPIKNFSTDPTFPGIPYLISGGGGATLYTTQTARSTTAAWEAAFHYTKLTFTNDAVAGKAIRSDGSQIEQFTIHHK